MPDFTWKGPLRLEVGKEKWQFTDKAQVNVEYTGPFSLCLTSRPARGATVVGFTSFGVTVDTAEVERLDGDAGVLRLTLISPQLAEGDFGTAALGEPQYELDFQELTKKVQEHPHCGHLTDAAVKAGADWDSIGDIADKGDTYYTTRGGAGDWSYRDYVDLRDRGVDEYPVKAPVVRRTTYHYSPPTDVGEDCFTRQNPPSEGWAHIADFEWIKGPDRCLKQGRLYTRTTEWWGADKLDPLLYPET